jgi:hypothetical protein
MQQAAQLEVNEIVIDKPYALMDDLERIEYLADGLDAYMECPFPRLKLLAWVAAELALGKHNGPDAGASLDNAYEDWISPDDNSDA